MNIKRIFFALWPDARQRDRMRDFISPHTKLVEGRAVERSEWHVTLAYIGDLDVRFIPELMESARAIPFAPFRLRLDRLEFWPRPKIAAVVPPRAPPELESLVEQLNGLVLASGVEPSQRVYRRTSRWRAGRGRSKPCDWRRMRRSSGLDSNSWSRLPSTAAPHTAR